MAFLNHNLQLFLHMTVVTSTSFSRCFLSVRCVASRVFHRDSRALRLALSFFVTTFAQNARIAHRREIAISSRVIVAGAPRQHMERNRGVFE